MQITALTWRMLGSSDQPEKPTINPSTEIGNLGILGGCNNIVFDIPS